MLKSFGSMSRCVGAKRISLVSHSKRLFTAVWITAWSMAVKADIIVTSRAQINMTAMARTAGVPLCAVVVGEIHNQSVTDGSNEK
jgi:hypothetical protein